MVFSISNDLILKSLSKHDAASLFTIISNERGSLREFLPFVDSLSRLEDMEVVAAAAENNTDNPIFTIQYKGNTLGIVGFKDTDTANRRTEIGYWISAAGRGKGLVTQACHTLIKYAFEELDVNRIQLKTAVSNLKSIAVAKRLGFTREGIEREGELLVSGFTDLYLYSLLKREAVG